MIVGNAIGLAQKNLKRLLAYSSIGHAGYLLVAIAAGTQQGSSAMLFYLFVYTLATFGAFAVVVTLTREGRGRASCSTSSRGSGRVRPWLALSMAVIMLALLGFPIFGGAGFFAKWYVLQAALQAPAKQTTLAVVLVLTTVVSAGYYLYVVMLMFMRPRAGRRAGDRALGRTDAARARGERRADLLVLGVVPEAVDATSRARDSRRMEVEPSTTQLPSPIGDRAARLGAATSPTRERPSESAELDGAAPRPRCLSA